MSTILTLGKLIRAACKAPWSCAVSLDPKMRPRRPGNPSTGGYQIEPCEGRRLLAIPAPAAPIGPQSYVGGSSQILVKWGDQSNNETGFTIERRLASGGSYGVVGTAAANADQYMDTGLNSGTAYTYRIKAFNSGGESIYTGETSATTLGASNPFATNAPVIGPVPAAPFGSQSYTGGDTQILVKWGAGLTNVSGFTVERRLSSGGAYGLVGSASADADQLMDTGLNPGTSYTYRIAAFNGNGNSPYSGETSSTTLGSSNSPAVVVQAPASIPAPVQTGPVPATPIGPQSYTGGDTNILVKWGAGPYNETGFTIERRTSTGGSYAVAGTAPAGSDQYMDTGLNPGTTFTYRIKATNASGSSGYTAETSSTTLGSSSSGFSASPPAPVATGPVPAAPFGPQSYVGGSSQILVKWADGSNNEDGYRIERRLSSGGAYSLVGTAPANSDQYMDTGLYSGTSYTYRIAAYNGKGNSPYTAETSSTTLGPSNAPAAPPPVAVVPPPPAPTPWNAAETTGYFTIGVYWQPISTYPTWKARGINTVVAFDYEPVGMEVLNNAAVANQLWMIRNPRQNIAADVGQPYLLAYEHDDEPDIQHVPAASLAAEYAAWKAGNPNIPVLVNVAGANVVYQADGLTDAMYKDYFATADWISSDTYPLASWGRPQWIDKAITLPANTDPWNFSTTPFNNGTAVDKVRELSGKKQFAYIETSFTDDAHSAAAGDRDPTPDEYRGETWDAIIHGAKGVIYFPFSFPNNNDGTPPAVVTEMTSTDALITQFGKVLNNQGDTTNAYVNLPGGLEATYRDFNGHRYYFVLNFSHTAMPNQKITLPGLGNGNVEVTGENRQLAASGDTITDSFGAYGVHIYRV